jgi:cell division protein FtsB
MKRLYLIIIILCILLAIGIFVEWWLAVSTGLLILGTLGHVERIFNVKWSKKWSILFLLLFILFSGWNIKRSWHAEDTAATTEKKINNLNGENKGQKGQIANLTKENEERRKEVEQAKNDVAAAKEELVNLSEYGEVATYTFKGYQQSGLFLSPFTPVSKWTDGYLTIREGDYFFNCSQDSINHYKNIIEKYPKFPFAYIALSRCLLDRKDSSWRQYAVKAQSILRKTTKIPIHCKEHDGWLEQVNKILDPTRLNSVLIP